jgi:hypothetical protein
MVRPRRDGLSGTLEVDKTFVGRKEHGANGQGTERKELGARAAQDHQAGSIGRIRVRRVEDEYPNRSLPFVANGVEPRSVVRTDGSIPKDGSKGLGFTHNAITVANAA